MRRKLARGGKWRGDSVGQLCRHERSVVQRKRERRAPVGKRRRARWTGKPFASAARLRLRLTASLTACLCDSFGFSFRFSLRHPLLPSLPFPSPSPLPPLRLSRRRFRTVTRCADGAVGGAAKRPASAAVGGPPRGRSFVPLPPTASASLGSSGQSRPPAPFPHPLPPLRMGRRLGSPAPRPEPPAPRPPRRFTRVHPSRAPWLGTPSTS